MALHARVAASAEGAADIVSSGGCDLLSLLGSVARAAQAKRDGKAEDSRQSLGEGGTLVVTAPPAALPVEGDRHNHVDGHCPQRIAPLGTPQFAHYLSERLAP